MAHEIDESTGRPAFVYDGQEGGAWHGLGQPIPEEIANDPRKIAALVGAMYMVRKSDCTYAPTYGNGDQQFSRIVPNRQVLYRDDTGAALEVLSDNRYKIVQPVEYFEAFRDSLAANHLRISSAGILKGGRIAFVNAKFTDGGYNVLGLDRIESYITMGGGYDGTMSSFGYLSDFRTVCWNTLSANLSKQGDAGKLFKVPHTIAFDGKALGAALGLAGKELQVRASVFNALAARKLATGEAVEYFSDILDLDADKIGKLDPKTGKPLISTRSMNQLEALANAYMTGPGATLPSASGTLWGALNAVTHFVDHLASTRDSYADGTDRARFASSQFGAGANVKRKALEKAMVIAGVEEELLQAAA
jgi:phage/plasmid-like protein (TIGR03299 family)